MKRLTLVTGILALAAPLALAQTSTWKSDPAHSEVDFTILHLSVSHVHGRFGHVDATLVLNAADITKSTVTATIDVTGVSTGEECGWHIERRRQPHPARSHQTRNALG